VSETTGHKVLNTYLTYCTDSWSFGHEPH